MTRFLKLKLAQTRKAATVTIFLLLFAVIVVGYSPTVKAEQSKVNGLTIALDTLRSSDTPQVLINFMKQWHYNSLRIYMGWCSSFWTGDINNPMNTKTQNFIDELCRLCAQNNFTVVCAVSAQVTPFKTSYHEEIQVGPNGEENSQGNWVCPTGPKFQTFTKNLVRILVNIMEKYATPRISVDEIVFVTGGGKPAFYSQSMKAVYRQATGKDIPLFSSTSGTYNNEQKQFIEFAKGTIRTFYQMIESTAKAENPNVWFGALVDTYWVYPKTSDDTQPYDYYATVDEIVYEWFYAIQNENWEGVTDGLRRIKNLNPSAIHYFIYGTSTMTSIANMRKSVELAMAEGYDGVFLYEYAKSRSNPFDVSDIVFSTGSTPEPSPSQTQYGTLKFSAWNGENWVVGAALTIMFPNGTIIDKFTPYENSQAPLGFYTVNCVNSGQEADNSPYSFTLDSNEVESYTFVFGPSPPPSSAYVFEDNFDSADFSKWTGISTSYGEVAEVVDTFADANGYCVQFSSNGRNEVEYAYCYKTVDMEEIWVSGDFYVSSGLPLDSNGDRAYLIRLMAGQYYVASIGIGRYDGSDRWVLYGRNGSERAGPFYSSSPAVEMKRWYHMELRWKKHSTLGVMEAYLNGLKIFSMNNLDTARYGNLSQINFGLMSMTEYGKSLSIYGDCFSFSTYKKTDVNCDGAVDLKDALSVAQACGSSIGDPRYQLNLDINDDEVIDVIDYMLVALDISRLNQNI
ncbi:hypothetical protein KEJ15_06240 [Candidatus Bathyarchaeota archaeon]|nr:hypothetical protein [Candidatus Bathyarchaeota archaeon]